MNLWKLWEQVRLKLHHQGMEERQPLWHEVPISMEICVAQPWHFLAIVTKLPSHLLHYQKVEWSRRSLAVDFKRLLIAITHRYTSMAEWKQCKYVGPGLANGRGRLTGSGTVCPRGGCCITHGGVCKRGESYVICDDWEQVVNIDWGDVSINSWEDGFTNSWEDAAVEGCEEGKDCTVNCMERRGAVFPDCIKVGGNGRCGCWEGSFTDVEGNAWDGTGVDTCIEYCGSIGSDIGVWVW